MNSDYVKRGETERKRRKLATDDGFWFTICFKSERDRDDFAGLLGLGECRFVGGPVLRKATERFKPGKPKRSATRMHPPCPGKNPLLRVDRTGNLESDSAAEAMAIFEAFKAAKRPEKVIVASTSDIWVCACFESYDDALAYQAEMQLGKYGARHLDGSAWLRDMRKTIM